jgi:hypothetical protein
LRALLKIYEVVVSEILLRPFRASVNLFCLGSQGFRPVLVYAAPSGLATKLIVSIYKYDNSHGRKPALSADGLAVMAIDLV